MALRAIAKAKRLQKLQAELRGESRTEPPPAPSFPEYWQARFPKYEYAKHVQVLAEKLSALGPGDALVINMPPRHGKCQPKGSPVLMADGSSKPIEEVVTGEPLCSVTERYNIDMSVTDDVFDNGVRECVRLHLDSGRSIDCTLNHPLLTVDGYAEAQTIRVGNSVATAARLPEGQTALPEGFAALLGYLAGDGSTTGTALKFTNIDFEILEHVRELLSLHGWTMRPDGPVGYFFARYDITEDIDAPKKALLPYGGGVIGCTSHHKRVPKSIFTAPNADVAQFIAAYFDCDGYALKLRGGGFEAVSASEGLLKDVQELLQRFSIFSYLRPKVKKYKGEARTYSSLFIGGAHLERLANAIPLQGKKRLEVAALVAKFADKNRYPRYESIPAGWKKHIKGVKHDYRKHHNLRFDKQYKEGTARHIVQKVADIEDNAHLKRLCSPDLWWEKVVRLERLGDCQTYGISVARDHVYISGGVVSHNSECVKAFLEWRMGLDPTTGVMFASYSAALANQASRQIRNEVQSGNAFGHYFPHVQLASDAKKVQQWRLRQNGGLIAAGMGGSLTGMGARIGVIDDPLKGRQQAESLKIREGVIDWFRADFFTRLEPGGILIVIQTRWHKGDISGWIEDNVKSGDFGDFNWDILNLPALAEDEDDPLGRKPGEALWPGNWPAEKLLKNRAILGEYDFASLYQQRPFLKGGSVFTDQVERFTPGEDLTGWRITLSADLASSIKTSADFSVLEALSAKGKGADMQGKVLEVRRGRFTMDEQIQHMLEMQEVYGAVWHVENSPNAIPVIQEARRRGVRVVTVRPVGDKYSRAMPYASAWNGGRVQVAFAPWALPFIAEHTEFKGDMTHDHDDQVDASSQGWNIALKAGSSFKVRSDAAG